MSEIEALKQAFAEYPWFERLKELEQVIDCNADLSLKIRRLKQTQKKMVQSEEAGKIREWTHLSEEYETIFKEVLDFPFVEEYLDLLDLAYDKLKTAQYIAEQKINRCLK